MAQCPAAPGGSAQHDTHMASNQPLETNAALLASSPLAWFLHFYLFILNSGLCEKLDSLPRKTERLLARKPWKRNMRSGLVFLCQQR